MTIRKATRSDGDALVGLWLNFLEEQAALDGRVAISEDAGERWRNDFPAWVERDKRHILVAEREGEIVGFAGAVRWSPPPVFSYTKEVFVEDFFVRPEHRRQGVGRQLYEAIVEWGASWGAQRVRLSVLSRNDAAQAFWRAVGLADLSLTMTADLETDRSEEEVERPKGRLGF